jgi:hypothetical protein
MDASDHASHPTRLEFQAAAPRIFICFASKDEENALDVVRYLESDGMSCWISSRDVGPGENYQEAIVSALELAQGVVFLFSECSQGSPEIKKELALADSMKRPVFPVRLAPVSPGGALRYELATHQWVDIFHDREAGLRSLSDAIRREVRTGRKPSRETLSAQSEEGVRDLKRHAPIDRPREPALHLTASQFEDIRLLLARRIGPIAKLLVHKCADEALTPEDFCQTLVQYVPDGAERKACWKELQTHLSSAG